MTSYLYTCKSSKDLSLVFQIPAQPNGMLHLPCQTLYPLMPQLQKKTLQAEPDLNPAHQLQRIPIKHSNAPNQFQVIRNYLFLQQLNQIHKQTTTPLKKYHN